MITFTSNNPGKREPDKYYLYPHQVPEDFRPWLDDQWYDLPDVITPKDVETILGYEHESVRRWINRGWLHITKAHNAELVPRDWLIDFTCDYAFRIARKSKILRLMHITLRERHSRRTFLFQFIDQFHHFCKNDEIGIDERQNW